MEDAVAVGLMVPDVGSTAVGDVAELVVLSAGVRVVEEARFVVDADVAKVVVDGHA